MFDFSLDGCIPEINMGVIIFFFKQKTAYEITR